MRNVAYLAAIVATVAVASHFAFELSRAGTSSFFLVMAVPTVALAVLGVLRARHDGILKSWVSVKSGDFSRGFAGAAVLFGAAYAFTRVVAPPESIRASWLARLYLQLGDPTALRKNVGVVVVAIIVIAIAEELVWRGLVVSLLEEQIGSHRAWVWAAVLYAVAHAPTIWALRDPVAGPNPVIVLAALGCGLVWGGMARRFERLLPSVFSHVLFDWTVIMMFRLWGPSV
ncbi:MAG: CPBP family intramembrane metalloprotease [Labilithrix sp.]|nr:CPBP family intramembrane metalloprotease [Labilithrix sp.]MBX3222821.1 CPBP family intramembrane metalloprotease [Labilithrix sp.]